MLRPSPWAHPLYGVLLCVVMCQAPGCIRDSLMVQGHGSVSVEVPIRPDGDGIVTVTRRTVLTLTGNAWVAGDINLILESGTRIRWDEPILNIRLTELSQEALPHSPAMLVAHSPAVKLEPEGLEFVDPALLNLPISSRGDHTPSLTTWQGSAAQGEWVDCEVSGACSAMRVLDGEGMAVAQLHHFSLWVMSAGYCLRVYDGLSKVLVDESGGVGSSHRLPSTWDRDPTRFSHLFVSLDPAEYNPDSQTWRCTGTQGALTIPSLRAEWMGPWAASALAPPPPAASVGFTRADGAVHLSASPATRIGHHRLKAAIPVTALDAGIYSLTGDTLCGGYAGPQYSLVDQEIYTCVEFEITPAVHALRTAHEPFSDTFYTFLITGAEERDICVRETPNPLAGGLTLLSEMGAEDQGNGWGLPGQSSVYRVQTESEPTSEVAPYFEPTPQGTQGERVVAAAALTTPYAATETCNGLDDDVDGKIDEGLTAADDDLYEDIAQCLEAGPCVLKAGNTYELAQPLTLGDGDHLCMAGGSTGAARVVASPDYASDSGAPLISVARGASVSLSGLPEARIIVDGAHLDDNGPITGDIEVPSDLPSALLYAAGGSAVALRHIDFEDAWPTNAGKPRMGAVWACGDDHCLDADQGGAGASTTLYLHGVTVTNPQNFGVRISGPDSRLTLSSSVINGHNGRETPQYGVIFQRGATGLIRGSTVSNHGYEGEEDTFSAGIYIEAAASGPLTEKTLEVSASLITDNQYGLYTVPFTELAAAGPAAQGARDAPCQWPSAHKLELRGSTLTRNDVGLMGYYLDDARIYSNAFSNLSVNVGQGLCSHQWLITANQFSTATYDLVVPPPSDEQYPTAQLMGNQFEGDELAGVKQLYCRCPGDSEATEGSSVPTELMLHLSPSCQREAGAADCYGYGSAAPPAQTPTPMEGILRCPPLPVALGHDGCRPVDTGASPSRQQKAAACNGPDSCGARTGCELIPSATSPARASRRLNLPPAARLASPRLSP